MSRDRLLLLGSTAAVGGAGLGFALGLSALGDASPAFVIPLAVFVAGASGWLVVARRSLRAADGASGLRLFRRELARARRFQEPLALLRIRAADPQAGSGGGVDAVWQTVRRLLRLTDVVWDDGDSVYVALPNTTRRSAGMWLSRIDPASVLRPAELTIAVFPDDALTETGLMGALAAVTPVRTFDASARAEARLERLDGDVTTQPGTRAG